ncbi:MAG: NAD(P)-dependent oxidoreductase [Alphaproteobacteria bacterium]|nr:NAD(P)-dependent oxidoreductase [Alphaproteobacteria bacterium]
MTTALPDGAIAVTGAAGYVGRRLVQQLAEAGRPVVALIRPTQALPPGATRLDFDDTIDAETLAEGLRDAGAVAAIHLAARYVRHHQPADIGPLLASNVLAGALLLEAADEAGLRRVVVADSAFAHQGPDGTRALGLYGATRQALGRIADRYAVDRELDLTTLVVHDVYGPDDTRRRLVPVLVDALMDEVEIRLVGAPVTVDLVHVDDVAAAFRIAVLQGPAGTWAVRSTQPLTPIEVADVLERVSGRRLKRRLVPAGIGPHPGTWAGPVLPGWSPTIPLDAGLTRLTQQLDD